MAWKDAETRRLYQRKWARAHKSTRWVEQIENRYGLGRGGYAALVQAQNGCCAICKRHQREFKKRLGVDHDHVTGQIRGVLCNECNLLLGYAKDSTDRLEVARQYLVRANETAEVVKLNVVA